VIARDSSVNFFLNYLGSGREKCEGKDVEGKIFGKSKVEFNRKVSEKN